jgi:predicted phage baseplate assembly protein
MVLPAPNLDDRTFQSLVDDAKRLVQQRCPEWTDHNVSDPGVTLIETFAYMVDQLLWRLNRVPDRTYVKFLDLLGVKLRSPNAAQAPVTFWLSAPQETTVAVPAGTLVATPRTDAEPVVFTTLDDLEIVPCSLAVVASEVDGEQVDRSDVLARGDSVSCFGPPPRVPRPGDCFYVGLSNAVPSCAVTLRFECPTRGVGIDPRYPPLAWEAWDGQRWSPCTVEDDTTGGLNWSGDVVLHLPRRHEAHAGVVRQAAGWLRCRVVEAESWQPTYTASPAVTRLSAFTIGGTTDAVNAEIVEDEVLGEAEGVPAQRLPLSNRPVVSGERPLDHVVEVGGMVDADAADQPGRNGRRGGWQEWTQVEDFAGSGPDDRHFVLDESNGEVIFGPAVREANNKLRRFGAVPPKGATVRIRSYRTGGGERGNVARGAISVLKSSIPYIASVSNRSGAIGGTDGEDIENAKLRGPLLLRTRQRAVTTEDYENLARTAAKDVARVRCVPAGEPRPGAGPEEGVRVLLVPAVDDGGGGDNRLEFHELMLSDDIYGRVAGYLEQRRTIGARVIVQPPDYVGLTVVTRLRARPGADERALERDALAALYGYFHPLRGGPNGTGWPFGRSVVGGEVYAVLQRLGPQVEFVEEVRLFPADPIERTRKKQVERLDIGPHELVFSWGHQVMVQSG